jgi:exosortase/archaeosortase family protein
MFLTRANGFVLGLVAAYLAPIGIPGVGLDYPYFFIMSIVLFAWFVFKWDGVKSLSQKANLPEVILGACIIGADYAENLAAGSRVGMIDLLVIFLGVVVAFYGLRSLKFFWVPMTYGIILLLGYQIENYAPNYVALQEWLASVLASSMRVLGISASVSGHLVVLNPHSNAPLFLDVESDCTGMQGILAFGMLSTMALLDMKPKISRLVPLFVVGFAGAFLINILRLIVVFLTFEFLGAEAGTTMHVYFGYVIFIAWVMVFWTLAFRYLAPRPTAGLPTAPMPPSPQVPV